MKIAIVSEYYYPLLGGITEHVHFFAKECARLQNDVTIITSKPGGKWLPVPPLENVEIIRMGRSIPFYSNGSFARISLGLGLKRNMRNILKPGKFDIVHIHSPSIPILPTMAQLVSTGPTVGTFHTYFDSDILYLLFKRIVQDSYENLDGRIAVSRLCVEALRKYFDVDFKIIPNGVDIEYFSTPTGKFNKFNDGKVNMLFLARLDPRNGLEALIKAFNIVRMKNKDVRLIVVGDGPLKSYYHLLAGKEMGRSICFEGAITDSRPDYYNACDIFCFPVQKASFGITILEAMAAGKSIVCSDLPAFRDILVGEDTARFVDPYDEHDLVSKLMVLIEDANLRKTLGENARRRVERFSWKNVTQEVLAYYGEILSNEPKKTY